MIIITKLIFLNLIFAMSDLHVCHITVDHVILFIGMNKIHCKISALLVDAHVLYKQSLDHLELALGLESVVTYLSGSFCFVWDQMGPMDFEVEDLKGPSPKGPKDHTSWG